MFSQTAEYALRSTVCMAQHQGKLLTTSEIAIFTQVPAGYLSKVLQALARVGLIEATRGFGGGYRLTRNPAEITILMVVNAVDSLKRIRSCPLRLESHGAELCSLHRRLDNAIQEVERALGSTTIADVLFNPTSSTPLCATRMDSPKPDTGSH